MIAEARWNPCFTTVNEFCQSHFWGLLANNYPAVVIDCFLDSDTCDLAAKNFESRPTLLEYRQDNVSSKYLGRSLVELADQPESYFDKVEDMFAETQTVFSDRHGEPLLSPLMRVMELVSNAWKPGAELAQESGRSYFAGIMRAVKRSPLHNDWAPRDFPSWSIGRIQEQFTWNVYLRSPDSGDGIVKIYDKTWNELDERFKHTSASMMGYEQEVVDSAKVASIEPKQGRLVIFKPSNYHEVTASSGETPRVSVSSFFGMFTTDKPMVFWS